MSCNNHVVKSVMDDLLHMLTNHTTVLFAVYVNHHQEQKKIIKP